MAEVIYYVASSLDGRIATAAGGVEWLEAFHTPGEDYGYRDFYASMDAIVLGSGTYEFALKLGKWPSPDKPSWVFTRRELPLLHPSITMTAEDPARVVASLAERKFERVWLMGGGRLAASFRAAGLIARYMIAVAPVVLGGGIPLFADGPGQQRLKLIETRRYPSGIVMSTYEPEDAEAPRR